MTKHPLIVSAIALFLGFTGPGFGKASGLPQAQTTSTYAQDSEIWDAPPEGLQEIQLKGFHDGIAGAQKDFDKHRQPNVNNRAEYRNPHLASDQKEAYCDGFRLGYERGASHFIAGPDQRVSLPEPPMREAVRSSPDVAAEASSGTSHSAGPGQGSEIQRRGFQEGMARARKDLDNHRRLDVNIRDESRHLKLSPELRLQYLAAFTQGYDHFMSEQAGGPLERH